MVNCYVKTYAFCVAAHFDELFLTFLFFCKMFGDKNATEDIKYFSDSKTKY